MAILWTFGRLGYPKNVDELLPPLNEQFKSLEVVLRQFATRTLADINDDLGTITVDAAHLASASVTSIHLATGAVNASAVATSAIGASAIINDAISAAHLKAGAVVTSAIAVGAVVASSIAADAIIASKIAAGAVVTSALAANAVVASAIAAGAVTANKISVSSLAAINANIGDITAGQIRDSSNTAGVFIDEFGTTVSVPATWTRFLNLAGTSANTSFLKHDLLDLKYDGTATFSGTVGASSFTAATAQFYNEIQIGNNGVFSTPLSLKKEELLFGYINLFAAYRPSINTIPGTDLIGAEIGFGFGDGTTTLLFLRQAANGGSRRALFDTIEVTPTSAGATTLGTSSLPFGNLVVTGPFAFGSVSGVTRIQRTSAEVIAFLGASDANASIEAAGATLAGTLSVTGAAVFSAGATVLGGLSVSANATVGGTLSVAGITGISSNLTVGGTLSVTGAATVAGNIRTTAGTYKTTDDSSGITQSATIVDAGLATHSFTFKNGILTAYSVA